MMIAGLFALSFSLAMGQAGMLSFGHSAYYGLGAFATLHLMKAVEGHLVAWPTPLLPLAGAAAASSSASCFGWLATQRTGVYFAMVTLALAELLFTLAPDLEVGVFGGGVRHLHDADELVGDQLRERHGGLLPDPRLGRRSRRGACGPSPGLRWAGSRSRSARTSTGSASSASTPTAPGR